MSEQAKLTPEQVQGRLSGLRKFCVWGTAVVMVFVIVVGGHALFNAKKLLSDSTVIVAEIVDLDQGTRRAKGGRKATTYNVTYAFTGVDGRHMTDTFGTNKTKFASYGNAGSVEVVQSKSNPDHFDRRALIERQSSLPKLMMRLFVLLGCVVLFFGFIYGVSALKLKAQLEPQPQ